MTSRESEYGIKEKLTPNEAMVFPWIIRQALDPHIPPMVRANPNLRVIDVGFGGGEGIAYLTSAGVNEGNIIGIGSNAENAHRVQSKFPLAQISTGDFTVTSDEDYQADLVTCLMVSRRLDHEQWNQV